MSIERPTAEEVPEPASLIVPLGEFKEDNFRVDGLRKAHSVGAPVPAPIYVIPNASFLFYRSFPDRFMPRVEAEIAEPAARAASSSSKDSLVVRRAYDLPDIPNPEGPRFLGIPPDPREVALKIKSMFDFAIERGYDRNPDAQIACFIYPFIDPENKPLDEIQPGDLLPYGCWMIPLSPDGSAQEIIATWGNNQTIIHYEKTGRPLETYIVRVDPQDPTRVQITKKRIVPKPVMHYTSSRGESEIVVVPTSHRLEQVMYDSEIVEIARYGFLLTQKYGPQRAELSSDGKRLFFTEVLSLEHDSLPGSPQEDTLPTEPGRKILCEGRALVVSSEEDIDRLAQLSPDERSQVLIYTTRLDAGGGTDPVNYNLGERFKEESLTVLHVGTAHTAHTITMLSSIGHKPIPIGRQDIREGDRVRVSQIRTSYFAENLTLLENNLVKTLKDAQNYGSGKVGGKAERLSYLKESIGYDVPDGVVLTTDFFDVVMETTGANRVLSSLISSAPRAEDFYNKMTEALPEIPDHIWAQVLPIIKRAGLTQKINVIVRSSANVEDVRGRGFAGVFESIGPVSDEQQIRRAVLQVLRSAFTPRVLAYDGMSLNEVAGIKMAILVQKLVDAQISGTLFGKDTITHNQDVVKIEAKRGLGREITDGTGVEERLIFQKSQWGANPIREGSGLLSTNQQLYLFQVATRLEEEFKHPQDIEWSIDQNGTIWILQARDL